MEHHIKRFQKFQESGERLLPPPEIFDLDPIIPKYIKFGQEGHLYIVKPPGLDEEQNIFKIGSTTQLLKRMYWYEQGTELYYTRYTHQKISGKLKNHGSKGYNETKHSVSSRAENISTGHGNMRSNYYPHLKPPPSRSIDHRGALTIAEFIFNSHPPLEKSGGHFSPGGYFFSQMYNEKIFKDSMAPGTCTGLNATSACHVSKSPPGTRRVT